MSSAPTALLSQGSGKTRVWLPVAFTSARTDTGFSSLPDSQVNDIISSLPRTRTVAPEVLGMRSDFADALEQDLVSGGPALDDFTLLMEALSYNLLRCKTYDLNEGRLQVPQLDHRFVTVLLFREHSNSAPVAAGSFSPQTVVCPAPEWLDKDKLKKKVMALRNTKVGLGGRGLMVAFLRAFDPNIGTLWGRAVSTFLQKCPGEDPGEKHQRNIGAFFLEQGAGADPIRVFFPQYDEEYLSVLSRKLCADQARPDINARAIQLYYRGTQICTLAQPNTDEPDLYGYGLEVDSATQARLPETELNEAAAQHISPFAIQYRAAIASFPPRFSVPDCLRCFFTKFGTAAGTQILGPLSPYVYSTSFLRLLSGGEALPHDQERFRMTGRQRDGVNDIVLERSGEAYVYYIEKFQGLDVRELSRLGSALWLLFCGDAEWQPSQRAAVFNNKRVLAVRNGRLETDEQLKVSRPDRVRNAVDLLKFVHNAKGADLLFRSSVECFLGDVFADFAHKASDSDAEPFDIDNRGWYRLRR